MSEFILFVITWGAILVAIYAGWRRSLLYSAICAAIFLGLNSITINSLGIYGSNDTLMFNIFIFIAWWITGFCARFIGNWLGRHNQEERKKHH